MRCDTVWRNARLATMAQDSDGIGAVNDGLIAAAQGRIIYAGEARHASAFDAAQTVDCEERWITPGLIDCHTHIIHGGDRAQEFAMRLAGASYEEIARAGGGILSTMRATRSASLDALVASALPRVDTLMAEGVTTLEIKSGYGLTLDDECRMLYAARALSHARTLRIVTSFLGAHALPPEYAGDADGYIDAVCGTMIPALAQEHLRRVQPVADNFAGWFYSFVSGQA